MFLATEIAKIDLKWLGISCELALISCPLAPWGLFFCGPFPTLINYSPHFCIHCSVILIISWHHPHIMTMWEHWWWVHHLMSLLNLRTCMVIMFNPCYVFEIEFFSCVKIFKWFGKKNDAFDDLIVGFLSRVSLKWKRNILQHTTLCMLMFELNLLDT